MRRAQFCERPMHPTEYYRLLWTLTDNVLAWLEPTKKCNIYCDGCYSTNEPDSHKTLAQVRSDLDVFTAERRFDSVSIAGGDPLMHPEIVEIVRIIRDQVGPGPHRHRARDGLHPVPHRAQQRVHLPLPGKTHRGGRAGVLGPGEEPQAAHHARGVRRDPRGGPRLRRRPPTSAAPPTRIRSSGRSSAASARPSGSTATSAPGSWRSCRTAITWSRGATSRMRAPTCSTRGGPRYSS